jgi:cell wall-associated NlpC family hydrolase
VICTALCVFTARPAFADPILPGVPDAGSRPAVSGTFQPPGTSGTGPAGMGGVAGTPPAATEPGPLGQRIMTESVALETVGQQLRKLDADLTEARLAATATRDTWTKAARELAELRDRVGHEAGEAYKAATALGPLGRLAPDLHQLSVLAPGLGQQPGGQATAREMERAGAAERAALIAQQAAAGKADELTRARDSAKADQTRRSVALTTLRTQNQTAYQRELAAIDAQQAALGAGMNIGAAVKGMAANPKAKLALQHAMSKRGAAYVWAAEGPNTFDCSGLVLWAYTQPGVGASLPRVANDQYFATRNKEVAVDNLLPGDLLFFATDKSDWRSVHHVGMYVGNGYMIHAPATGDVVKVSPVWWSEFYKATRVFDAVGVAGPAPILPPAPVIPPPTTPPSTPPAGSTPPPPTTPPPPSESKPADPPPSESKPADPPPSESKPADPPQSQPADPPPSESKPAGPPPQSNPADPSPSQSTPTTTPSSTTSTAPNSTPAPTPTSASSSASSSASAGSSALATPSPSRS